MITFAPFTNLPQPRVPPILDSEFRPASLACRAYIDAAQATGNAVPVGVAVEQADGSVFTTQTSIFPATHSRADENPRFIERLIKFLLWSRGGWRVHIAGPLELVDGLRQYYAQDALGQFDADMMGARIYEKPLEIVACPELPPEKSQTAPLGRHLDGCRIGFDLGGSDRKVAAVLEGECVFSEEVEWNPIPATDPQFHYDGIMDSLRRAATHLPRVDAIGGSAAGVYVNNRVKVASLFRSVPPEAFNRRVKDLFLELKRDWGGIPFEVVNDGEVTALAGSMSLERNGVLGLAMGTSTAAGYVTSEGNITTWLNELAFAPIDYSPVAPVDEWSGDRGCGVQYFSQQGVGRLIPKAGVDLPADMPLPDKLKAVQALMAKGDERARKIYESIGSCLGYALAHYASFYEFNSLLILGRVTTGSGGEAIMDLARKVLEIEFPELFHKIQFVVPDEKSRRHGQAIAAASLPGLAAS